MNRIYYLALLCWLTCLTACQDEAAYEELTAPDQISLTTSIVPSTRIHTDLNGKGYFTEGDRIALFVAPENAASAQLHTLTLTPGGWTPAFGWKDIQANQAVLSGFYPTFSAETAGLTHMHTVAENQTEQKAYENSDLLYARTTLTYGETTATLAFSHLMSRLVVTLTSDGSLSPDDLNQAQIVFLAHNGIGVHTLTGELTPPASRPVSRFTMHALGNGSYDAVVCPQPVEPDWQTGEWMEIRIGDKVYPYRLPKQFADGTDWQSFDSGKQIHLRIELKKKGEDQNWCNQTGWVFGVNNPPAKDWHYVSVTPYEFKGLKWAPEYGWYDCNKRFPNRGEGNNDSEMCWAAASSNLLYWWMDQNRDYIQQYGKYNGPHTYKNSLDCDIFDWYKRHFDNTGNDVAAALSWFLTGRYGMGTKGGAGFFEEVFGSIPVARITRFSERSLSEELQYAFTHQEGIECTIRYPKGNLIHAITVWGATFDAQGEVSVIYITENNDRDVDEQLEFVDYKNRQITQAGMLEKRVQQKADGYFYMESSIPNQYTFRIEELNLLPLMREQWQAYFDRKQ